MSVPDPTTASTLVELLTWRAELQPDRRAYTYLDEGEEVASFDYAGLDRSARAIAARLQADLPQGSRAILVYPPGLDFIAAFFGCLYSGVVAVPVYPPIPSAIAAALPRLSGLVRDAAPGVILTTSLLKSIFEPPLAATLGDLPWLATDGVDPELGDAWRNPRVSAGSLAFLQYTSGSTATPRGVMVSHGNLVHNERVIQVAMHHDADSTFAGWLPLYHDMGLVGNVLQPLFIGSHCVLISPLSFLQSPYRWLEAITRHQAHTSGAPNFAYDLCVRKVTREQKAELDLSSWRIAYNGAEPVRSETLRRFSEAFAGCGFEPHAFWPCYGLAEASLLVSGPEPGKGAATIEVDREALEQNQVVIRDTPDEGSRALVSVGRTWLDVEVEIADPVRLQPAPPGAIGEVWVAGPSVAGGYWNLPDETAAAFHARLAGAGRYLRTGDLGFRAGDQLFITGRIKDAIIIAGRNHYPHDIELTAEGSHPAVRAGNCIAFPVDARGEERLVIVAGLDSRLPGVDPEAVCAAVRRNVSEQHGVAVYDLVLINGVVPKTTSGKVQRHACRAQYLAGAYQASRLAC